MCPPVRRTLTPGTTSTSPVDLRELPGGAHPLELLPLHDSLQPELIAARRLDLVPLDDVAGTTEERLPGRIHHAAGVVVVKVADDDEVDAVGVLAQLAGAPRRGSRPRFP